MAEAENVKRPVHARTVGSHGWSVTPGTAYRVRRGRRCGCKHRLELRDDCDSNECASNNTTSRAVRLSDASEARPSPDASAKSHEHCCTRHSGHTSESTPFAAWHGTCHCTRSPDPERICVCECWQQLAEAIVRPCPFVHIEFCSEVFISGWVIHGRCCQFSQSGSPRYRVRR